MILKRGPSRAQGRGSFVALVAYIERGGADATEQRPDLVASWSHNVATHATAAIEMETIARRDPHLRGASARRDRALKDPVYHLILSWRPGEEATVADAQTAVGIALRALAAEHHQYVVALHHDESADGGPSRYHAHVALNRVNPLTLRTLPSSYDFARLAQAAEQIEAELALRPDRHMASWRQHVAESELRLVPEGAPTREADAAHRHGLSWTALVRQRAVPAVRAAIAAEPTAAVLRAVLLTYGLQLARTARGGVLVGAEPGRHVSLSRAGLSLAQLERQLGALDAPTIAQLGADRAALRIAARGATSWDDLHAGLEARGVTCEVRPRGATIIDLATGTRHPAGRWLGQSLAQLEARLGPCPGSAPAATALRATVAQERAARESDLLARLRAGDRAIVDLAIARVTEHHAVFRARDIAGELARIVGVDVARIGEDELAPVLAACTMCEHTWREQLYSTARLAAEELDMLARARRLRRGNSGAGVDAPDVTGLDAAQAAAARALVGDERGLSLLTGIAGAGKSRLLRAVVGAYQRAGYEVIGTAVAGSAARTLGDEAQIRAITIAALFERGVRSRRAGRTVIIVDEASQLSTPMMAQLAQLAGEANQKVILLGDTHQHGAVARGAPFAQLCAEYDAPDLAVSRRARDPWLRKVAAELRDGSTAAALFALRERGLVHAHATHDDAIASAATALATAIDRGDHVMGIALRRRDVDALNRAVHDRRALAAESCEYDTTGGRRAFAVGDVVEAREPASDLDVVNGQLFRVAGVGVGASVLHLAPIEGGKTVTWDVRRRPAIEYGYASTSYRAQGRTIDRAIIVASKADAQASLYVDVTRARIIPEIHYGANEIEDFGGLLNAAAREERPRTVRGLDLPAERHEFRAARDATIEREGTIVRTPVVERERELEPALELDNELEQ